MKKILCKCNGITMMILIFLNIAVYASNIKKDIPVLMYHHISNTIKSDWSITPQKLNEQLAYLKNNGYTAISLDMLYSYKENKTILPEKSVVITFDDGYSDEYNNAYPLLTKYGFKATFFIITGSVLKKNEDGNEYMLLEDLKRLNKGGMDLEAHTVTHPDLSKLSYKQQYNELYKSKKYLEKNFHRKINYMAYPYGLCNNLTHKAAKRIGYRIAFTINGGHEDTYNNRLDIGRIYINQRMTLNEFTKALAGS
jgi:peptidoglycan/xylan/chitin deacetylase (PgdA/CDA1 family)